MLAVILLLPLLVTHAAGVTLCGRLGLLWLSALLISYCPPPFLFPPTVSILPGWIVKRWPHRVKERWLEGFMKKTLVFKESDSTSSPRLLAPTHLFPAPSSLPVGDVGLLGFWSSKSHEDIFQWLCMYMNLFLRESSVYILYFSHSFQ